MYTQYAADCLQVLKCKVIQYPYIRGTSWAGVELQKITCQCMSCYLNENNVGVRECMTKQWLLAPNVIRFYLS